MPIVVKSVDEAIDQQYDHVFLTKAIPELASTPRILKALLSAPYTERFSQPTYVLLQNGLNIEVDLYQAAKSLGQGEPNIISTAVYTVANLLAPNVVQHGPSVSLNGKLVIRCLHHDHETRTN